MGAHGVRSGSLDDPETVAWLEAVNSKPDFLPAPSSEAFENVRGQRDAALDYVTRLYDPVPTLLAARMAEDNFRDGLARIWRLLATDGLTLNVALSDQRDGETVVTNGVANVWVGHGPESPFGTVPDPSSSA